MEVLVLNETEIRKCVQVNMEAIAVVEDGFSRLARGEVTMPPIMRVDVPEKNGEVDVKSAYVRGVDGLAVKMSSGFFGNYKVGLPSLSGMMILLSAQTGVPQAVLLDNGYLTDVRTGSAGAVAAKWLAPEKVATAGVIGAGSQARYQMMALKQVRDYQRLLVYSLEGVEKYVDEMASVLGVEIVAVEDPAEVVENSQVVVTSTPSKEPFLKAEWLHPGMHITAMGADAEGKQELFPQALEAADRLFCDRKSQCFRLGELHHALEAGLISEDAPVTELGEVTAGMKPGRVDPSEITICDLTGTGVQDTVIANLAYKKALEQDFGVRIES
ncbi:MAG TPA: cyclodeaminase [Anaerolineales bacterium]|nr:cyclodeaminase [Anaerolineales bacterium]